MLTMTRVPFIWVPETIDRRGLRPGHAGTVRVPDDFQTVLVVVRI